MDIKDLMIGDWVYRPDCYDQVKETRQNGIIGLDRLRGLIGFQKLFYCANRNDKACENFERKED